MGKQKTCKGKRKSYKAEIKFPVRKICVHCGKQMTRDLYDIPKYTFQSKEFCSSKCYSNYINATQVESLKKMAVKKKC